MKITGRIVHRASRCIRRLVVLSLAYSFIVATEKPSKSEDWTQFLGPLGTGVSSETGLLDRWAESGPPVLWSKAVGTGYSAPSILGGRLVLHHRLKNEEIVECLDAATGERVWRFAYESRYVDPYGYNNGPRCSPVLTPTRCYTFGAEGKLVCLNLQTGKLVWERNTAKEWEIPPAFFGVGSTPILEGGFLLVMVGGQPNAGMVALDPETGKTAWESVGERNWTGQPMLGWPGERTVTWQRSEKQASYSTPFAVTIHGKRHVFCLMRQGLVSLDPAKGEVNFSRWFRSALNDSVNAMRPVVVDDLVFISAAYYRVGSVLLQVNPDGRGFNESWRSPRDLRERDPQTGQPTAPVLEMHWSTPIYHDGYLYAFSGRNEPDARFRCVEFKTGKLMWDRDESWPPHSSMTPSVYGRGSCILADGKLIALGEGGLLGLFKPNPEKPEEICRFQVPGLHYPCWAAPVLSEKRLYLRGEDRLVSIDFAMR
ncbi:MAG: PQQ-binding-like beta-propeller repeat protein [Verrucomicrobia bacterium]|nr:PQQ-binding-like beta-propeller repeat protein [Verrucomicrobiota bacterium]